jgi:putative copper export protein
MLGFEAVVSALGFVTLAIFFGQILSAAFLLPKGTPEGVRNSLVKSSLPWLLGFFGVALAALVLQGAKIQRAMPSFDLLWRYLTTTYSGRIWLGRLFWTLLLAAIVGWHRSSSKPAAVRCVALLAVPLVASRSLMSHAAALRDGASLAITADAVHSIATASWAGGLIALWRLLSRRGRGHRQPLIWTAEVVVRFSRLALASVIVIIGTGLYQSWIHLGSFATVLKTDYGVVLVIKLTLFLAMLSWGAVNLFSTKPLFRHFAGRDEDARSLRDLASRRVALESCIGVLIFGATGLLTVLPPGVHALHQAAAKTLSSAPRGQDQTQRLAPAVGASVKIL